MSIRAKYLRSYFFELTRILNHIMRLLHMQLMLCIDTIFMGFEERETIMNFMNGLAVPDYTLRNFRPGVFLVMYPRVFLKIFARFAEILY